MANWTNSYHSKGLFILYLSILMLTLTGCVTYSHKDHTIEDSSGLAIHEDHTIENSSGLTKIVSMSSNDMINLSFEHTLPKNKTISFTAPFVVANVKTKQGENSSFTIQFSIEGGDMSAFSSNATSRIESGETPVSVSFNVSSQKSISSAIENFEHGKAELPGYCEMDLEFSGNTTERSGRLPCKILVSEIGSDFYPIPRTGRELLHWNIFDCHSHWGIGWFTCHSKTRCSEFKCCCDVWHKATSCEGSGWCECKC